MHVSCGRKKISNHKLSSLRVKLGGNGAFLDFKGREDNCVLIGDSRCEQITQIIKERKNTHFSKEAFDEIDKIVLQH